MNKNLIPFAALGLSGLACVLAVMAFSRVERISVPTSPVTAQDMERLDALARQTATLRGDVERLANSMREGSASREPIEKPAEQAGVPPELLQRLGGLEESIAALQRKAKDHASILDQTQGDPAGLADAQRRATDPRVSEQEKLDALKALRGRKLGGQAAISHDVVLAMTDLAEHSPNDATRADAYRNLHRVDDRALRDSMLRALASDPSPMVRDQVAKDIDSFLPDVEVEGALRQAADGDADPGVRAAASETLARRR